MKRLVVGIVDYGAGNQASVIHALRLIGFRVKVSSDTETLDTTDILLMPGVGAFPDAMNALNQKNLSTYLRQKAKMGMPIIGICLGMQLLVDCSAEFKNTAGLGIIPGRVIPFSDDSWHIGWNEVRCNYKNPAHYLIDGTSFYFNHSYVYSGPEEYQVGVSENKSVFPVLIQKGSIVGIQFHPEKSQDAGRVLLKKLIIELVEHA